MIDPFGAERRVHTKTEKSDNSEYFQYATQRQLMEKVFRESYEKEKAKNAIVAYCHELMKRKKSELTSEQISLLRENNFIL